MKNSKSDYQPKENIIQDKSLDFAISLIHLYKDLLEEKEFVLSRQLLRSGTSIGANIEEAIAAESGKDFLHKISISLKEARETQYWLKLIKEGAFVRKDLTSYQHDVNEIIKILSSIVLTTKRKLS